MKVMKIFSLILILGLISVTVGNLQAEARDFNRNAPRPWNSHPIIQEPAMMMARMLKAFSTDLKLTTEQEQEIAALVAKYWVAQKNKREDIRKTRIDLMKKMLTENLDEASVRAEYQKFVAEKEQLREDHFVESAKLLSDIKSNLTEEQLNIVQEKSDEWLQKQSLPQNSMFDKKRSEMRERRKK